jgi:hypothetical protein
MQTQKIMPIELDDKVIAFPGFAVFSSLWRAIKFLMGQSVDSTVDVVFLPAVYMNALSNFFSWKGRKGLDLLKKMLDIAELVFVSVFPGSFETLFPLDQSHKNEIFKFDVVEPNTYSVICISRNNSLIEYLASRWQQDL